MTTARIVPILFYITSRSRSPAEARNRHFPPSCIKFYDTSNKLYFEPLTVEDVLSIYEKEKPDGIICQFGGQTPLKMAA